MADDLHRLNTLDGEEQIAFALKLIRARKNKTNVTEALRVLTGLEYSTPEFRALLLSTYAHYEADPIKRDPSSPVRAAILKALHPMARAEDVSLLEKATATYERIPPGMWEEAGVMRAAGLVVLAALDRELAAYHAVRLLGEDARTLSGMMSGEPGQTAIRVLAAQGHILPIYGYLVQDRESVAEAIAEGFRALTEIPASLLPTIVTKYRDSTNDIILGGLFDLLLSHEARLEWTAFIQEFLATTTNYIVYRYLITALVASRRAELLNLLLDSAGAELDLRKVTALIETLSLVQADEAAASVVARLRGLAGG